MSGSLDHPFFEAFGILAGKPVERDMANRQSQPDYASSARNDAGLLGSVPWRSIPLWVSNDRAEPYFEIYRVMPAHMLASRAGPEDWRWRFCTADGHVQAASGSYTNASDCRNAIDALRRTAGGARVRQIGEG
ncbi:YegP family protein [Sphingobium sp. EM0848]|uniref:YegP family protein n=1 Tax=Sphingobium sp. EM0848 TaxID=2743473 RepID=UPI00159C907F|nr:YegP family protein [Sphingobium sp. EM0848]